MSLSSHSNEYRKCLMFVKWWEGWEDQDNIRPSAHCKKEYLCKKVQDVCKSEL